MPRATDATGATASYLIAILAALALGNSTGAEEVLTTDERPKRLRSEARLEAHQVRFTVDWMDLGSFIFRAIWAR